MTTTIAFLGQRMPALAPIAQVAEALGRPRSTAFKHAEEEWPLHGSKHNRRVVVPALLEQLGIPYECIVEEPMDVAS